MNSYFYLRFFRKKLNIPKSLRKLHIYILKHGLIFIKLVGVYKVFSFKKCGKCEVISRD